ncbi:MAG: GNAT family N-acetyltransferase [Microthrixaceae bacterium]
MGDRRRVTPQLQRSEVLLRPGVERDVLPLVELFDEEAVERWWFAQNEAKVRKRLADPDQFGWVVEAQQMVRGWIQAGEEDDEEYREAWIDIAMSPSVHGTGLALESLWAVMGFLVEHRGHHRVTIDPDVDNTRAVRAYEKAGFRRVGVMRHYCRRPDGSMGDGLLMEWVLGIDDPLPEPPA